MAILTLRRDETLRDTEGNVLLDFKGKKGKELRNELRQNERVQEVVHNIYTGIFGTPRTQREIRNANGFEVDITTMTTIRQKITEQKFYTVNPAQYVPIVTGEGAFSTNLVTYRSFETGADFEDGIIRAGANNARLQSVNATVDTVTIKTVNWVKELSYNIFQIKEAARAGNWSLVTTLEKSRKRNWDLGIQKVAFLGLRNDPDVRGLLNLSNVTIDTSTLTKPLKNMTSDEINTFVQTLIGAYLVNTNYTAMPNRFIIPLTDWTGLAGVVSPSFPIAGSQKLTFLLNAFRTVTNNPNFEILPVSYCQSEINKTVLGSGSGINRYVLLNADEETLVMNIPVNYTTTIQDTVNGFQWNSAAYGEFTGVALFRNLEVMYFDYTGVIGNS
jgi:Uncharacterized protein conserved in bacteria (DUF2184)